MKIAIAADHQFELYTFKIVHHSHKTHRFGIAVETTAITQ